MLLEDIIKLSEASAHNLLKSLIASRGSIQPELIAALAIRVAQLRAEGESDLDYIEMLETYIDRNMPR